MLSTFNFARSAFLIRFQILSELITGTFSEIIRPKSRTGKSGSCVRAAHDE